MTCEKIVVMSRSNVRSVVEHVESAGNKEKLVNQAPVQPENESFINQSAIEEIRKLMCVALLARYRIELFLILKFQHIFQENFLLIK